MSVGVMTMAMTMIVCSLSFSVLSEMRWRLWLVMVESRDPLREKNEKDGPSGYPVRLGVCGCRARASAACAVPGSLGMQSAGCKALVSRAIGL